MYLYGIKFGYLISLRVFVGRIVRCFCSCNVFIIVEFISSIIEEGERRIEGRVIIFLVEDFEILRKDSFLVRIIIRIFLNFRKLEISIFDVIRVKKEVVIIYKNLGLIDIKFRKSMIESCELMWIKLVI